MVLKKNQLLFYKDQKHAKNEPEKYYKGEAAMNLKDIAIEVASNYTKKKHVFRLKLPNGAEYLLQAKDDAEMEHWLNKINSTVKTSAPSPGPSRSQTMPTKGSSSVEKKGGVFTMKKK